MSLAPALRAGRRASLLQPGTPKQNGFLGIDPMTWLQIAGAFAHGAEGGGWSGALGGTANALQGRQQKQEQEGQSDAQRRALMAMQAGDMQGAMQILAQAKGLEGQALQAQMAQTQRQDDRAYEGGLRTQDRDWRREDMNTQRGWQTADQTTEFGWRDRNREDEQRHDLAKPRTPTDQEIWRPATQQDVATYSLPNAGYLISNRGDVKPVTDSRKLGQVPASVQVMDAKYLDTLDADAGSQLGLSGQMNNWVEQAKNYGAQGEGILQDIGQVFSMNTSRLKGLTDEMTPQVKPPSSGIMTDADAIMYKNAVPQINNTAPANKAIAERKAAGAKRMQDHAMFMRQWSAENPGKMNEGKLAWTKYAKENPIYNPDGSINTKAVDPFTWLATRGSQTAGGDVSDLVTKYLGPR